MFGRLKTAKDGKDSRCRKCCSNQKNITYNSMDFRSRKNYWLIKRYKITMDEFEDLLNKQEGKCKICSKLLENSDKPNVDHCHKTNKIRGLLCVNCNKGIGHLFDDVELLQKAIDYLKSV